MKKNRLTAIVLVIMVMVMLLGGCGSKSEGNNVGDDGQKVTPSANTAKEETPTEATEDVKLTIWIAGSGDEITDKAYRAVLDAYCKEHSNVSYELTFITWADYFTKLNTGLIGGTGPDIFMLGYGQMGSVQAAGSLLPLNSYIPEDWDGYDDFSENILGICQKDEEYYGLFRPSTRTFMYRKDIAEQNGVTEEDLHVSSQEDLVNLAKKMTVKDANGNTQIYGMDIDPDSEQFFYVFYAQLSDKPSLWKEDYTANFNNEEAEKALETFKMLYDEGYACLLDPSATTTGLASGISAISQSADAQYATADAAFPGQIGVIKNDMNTLLIGDYFAVNNATKHPGEAADLLLHMFSKESGDTFAKLQGQFSGRKSLEESYIAINPDYENIVYSYQNSVSYGKSMHPKFNEDVNVLRTTLEGIFYDEDIKKTLSSMEENWNSILAK